MGNYSAVLNKLFIKGGHVNIFKFNRVFKIALSPTGIKKLNREMRNSKKALEWEIYASRIVPLKKIAPFAGISVFIEDEGKDKPTYKLGKLIDFFIENFEYALRAPKVPANEIINNQIINLGIDLTKDHSVYSHLKRSLNSDYLTFKLPMTPMHGDISYQNSLIEGDTLRLIDFELALEKGSILYDWWCLQKRISKIQNEKTRAFNAFIEKYLDKLDLNVDQFNAFGYAMFCVSSICGWETKKFKSLKKTGKYIDRLEKIIFRNEDLSHVHSPEPS